MYSYGAALTRQTACHCQFTDTQHFKSNMVYQSDNNCQYRTAEVAQNADINTPSSYTCISADGIISKFAASENR